MDKNKVVVFIGLCLVTLTGTILHGQTTGSPYQALRLGKDQFPASEATLLRMRDQPDTTGMRAHAWDLFQGLTQPPVWETWYTKCDVHLEVQNKCPDLGIENNFDHRRLFRGFEIPVQSLLSLSKLLAIQEIVPPVRSKNTRRQLVGAHSAVVQFTTEFGRHPQFASVLYNQEARDHIVNCLHSTPMVPQRRTSADCPQIPSSQREIPAFPRSAVVLKTDWALVHRPNPGQQLPAIKTWNSKLWNEIQLANDDPFRLQKDTSINTDPTIKCANRDYGPAESVPLSCFYFWQLTQADIDSFPKYLIRIGDKGIIKGDFLILIAMHVTTKEIGDWVWATFWWDNLAITDKRGSGRPSKIASNWKHYLMETTLSEKTPKESDEGPKIAFNPYLETSMPHGAISNCMQCHSKAFFSNPSRQTNGLDEGILARHGKKLASNNSPDPDYFKDGVKTDFMWSLVSPQNKILVHVLDLIKNMDTTKVQQTAPSRH